MLERSWSQVEPNVEGTSMMGSVVVALITFWLICGLQCWRTSKIPGDAAVWSPWIFPRPFNRLDHSHIIRSYARLGASTEVIKLLACFLHGRTMRVKVGEFLSPLRPVNGGAPQGSCAGVQLYSVGTDDIDDEIPVPEPRGP